MALWFTMVFRRVLAFIAAFATIAASGTANALAAGVPTIEKQPKAAKTPKTPKKIDLLVYGGTASGVITAYAAAREGLRVVLLEPGDHLGGMVTGGLSATDLGHFQIIGGYARDYYLEAASHYGLHDLDTASNWRSEPHIDEAIFRKWLKKAHVKVKFRQRLDQSDAVLKDGKHVVAVTTEDGRIWKAKIFADCSYEGDLMAAARISYTVGREATNVYNEDLAGVRLNTPKHQFLWSISPYDDAHNLLPEVDPGPLAPQGSGDFRVQAYNFRLVLTNDPANKLPWTQPENYIPTRFALLARYLNEFEQHMGRTPVVHDIMNPVAIPNHKADFNNNGAFSTDYLGKSWRYPDAAYEDRKRLWQEHLLYTQAFVYFLSQDPQVPATLRAEMNTWGRPKDEFADTDHWPNQLYIREGRRMVGQYVLHQADLQSQRTKPDSIGMGSYNSDSHNVQRTALPDGSVQNEGDVQVPVQPYEIPFRSILPKPIEADNLLVPVCLSASHIAYSSVRMEPQYMIIGQAAGIAAALAVKTKVSIQNVSLPTLQQRLRLHGAILHLDQEAKSTQPVPTK
jgi:hypothetical protein